MEVISHFPPAGGAAPEDGQGLERAFLYCKPFLCNAPSTDLVTLLESLLTRRDGTIPITSPGGAAPGARKVIDYCRKNGWRTANLQERLLHADFGCAYLFSQGLFWHNQEAIQTCRCHVSVDEGEGVTLRLGGRCRGRDPSRSCRAGLEVHLRLEENWEGRTRVVGYGKERKCLCGHKLEGSAPAVYIVATETLKTGVETTWEISEEAARAPHAGLYTMSYAYAPTAMMVIKPEPGAHERALDKE